MGTKLGWILAAVTAVVVITLTVWLVFFPSPTSPTVATEGDKLKLVKPAQPATLVLPAEPGGDGDAGDDYDQAMKLRHDNENAYKDAVINLGKNAMTEADAAVMEQINRPIHAGAAKAKMTHYFRLTPQKIEIPYFAEVEAGEFQDMCDAPLALAGYNLAKGTEEGYAQAEKHLQDYFTVGYHLINERARIELVQRGAGLEKEACNRLLLLYGKDKWNKPERAARVKTYLEGLAELSTAMTDLTRVCWSLNLQESGFKGPHPGDVANLVAHHEDHGVRAEAILSLGVVKLTCSSRGDHKQVDRLIEEKLNSADPVERVAAQNARDLTQEGYKKLLNSVAKNL